jgi:hypothetical protein
VRPPNAHLADDVMRTLLDERQAKSRRWSKSRCPLRNKRQSCTGIMAAAAKLGKDVKITFDETGKIITSVFMITPGTSGPVKANGNVNELDEWLTKHAHDHERPKSGP